MSPNRQKVEIYVNKKTTMEINPEPMTFIRKLFTEETAQHDKLTLP